MAHDVFISHSHKDKQIADAICTNLEIAGIRCWIAPRDIGPGEQWPEAIGREIPKSRVMVMIFSSDSNNSDQVYRELFIAADNKVVIIPFKIEDVELNPRIGFLLAGTHWLDAISPPIQAQIDILVTRVKSILGPLPPPPPTLPLKPARRIPAWTWLILTLVLFLVVGAASVFLWEQTHKAVPLTSSVPALTNASEVSATQVSGSQSEQARAFAGPILSAIAQRKPDFEDDFSNVNPDWFINSSGHGTSAIEDGVARLQTNNGDVGMFNDTALTGKDFVLQLDARLVSGDTTSEISVGLHNASETHKYWLFLHPAIKAWETGGVWGSNFFGTLSSGEDAVSPVGNITHISIITRGTRFALYLNQIPVGFFDNGNFNNAGKTQFRFTSASPAVCEFDNIKYWNLANIPGMP